MRAAGFACQLRLSLLGCQNATVRVRFPYFGGDGHPHFRELKLDKVLVHKLPVKTLTLADGRQVQVTMVYELLLAHYGLDRGLNDENCAASYDELKAYTLAWAEQITGISRQNLILI